MAENKDPIWIKYILLNRKIHNHLTRKNGKISHKSIDSKVYPNSTLKDNNVRRTVRTLKVNTSRYYHIPKYFIKLPIK